MANASAALPPLPSVRAKELEKRASALSQRHASTDDGGGQKDTDAQIGQTETNVEKPIESLNASIQSKRESSVHSLEQPHHRERLKQIEILHQKERKVFAQLPSLDPTVTCDAIHQYLSTTSQFLNSFIADANASLDGTSHKISVLEKQMSLLESKIASIPGLLPEDDQEQNVEATSHDDLVDGVI
jgi:hypothetical protein